MWLGKSVVGAFKRKQSGTVADLGEENRLYFNEELKAWVEKGKEDEFKQQQQASAAPPVMTGAIKINKDRKAVSARYVIPDNLKVAAAPSTSDSASSMFLPGRPATSPSPVAGAPKFFIPQMPAQQASVNSFADSKFSSYSEPSPSPVSVLDPPKSVAGTETDDSRPSSVMDNNGTAAQAAPGLPAPGRFALPASPDNLSSSRLTTPAASIAEPEASSSTASITAPACSGLQPYSAPARDALAGARSGTVDTAGSSISREEHQANTAKMLSKWLPDRSLGKISPLPWEEDFAHSSATSASAAFHPIFSWDVASKAAARTSTTEQLVSAPTPTGLEAEQRAAKSQRTSLDDNSAPAASAPATPSAEANLAAAAQPSIWGPHSASSIYSPSASTKGTDEALVYTEAAEAAAEPTPMSKPLFQLTGSTCERQGSEEEQSPEQERQQEQEEVVPAIILAEEQSWQSSQGIFHMPAAQPQQGQEQEAAAAVSFEDAAYSGCYQQQQELQAEASSYSYYGGISISPEAPAPVACGPATPGDTALAGVDASADSFEYPADPEAFASEQQSEQQEQEHATSSSYEQQQQQQQEQPSTSGYEQQQQQQQLEFAPWAAIVASMHEAGFASDPAMQSYMAYFVQYGEYLVSALPNKEALLADLAGRLAPAAEAGAGAALAAAEAEAGAASRSSDMAVVLESGGKKGAVAAAAGGEEEGGAYLTDEELSLYGETMYKADLMEAVFNAAGLSVGTLLESL